MIDKAKSQSLDELNKRLDDMEARLEDALSIIVEHMFNQTEMLSKMSKKTSSSSDVV